MATEAPERAYLDLLIQLKQATHALMAELAAGLDEIGISPRDHCVLAKAMTGEFTQIQLAEMTNLDKTTMVVTLDELENSGLAERHPSSTDRRARIVTVTKAGNRLVAKADGIVARICADVLGSLPEAERQGFVDGLDRLVHDRLARPPHCDRPPRRLT